MPGYEDARTHLRALGRRARPHAWRRRRRHPWGWAPRPRPLNRHLPTGLQLRLQPWGDVPAGRRDPETRPDAPISSSPNALSSYCAAGGKLGTVEGASELWTFFKKIKKTRYQNNMKKEKKWGLSRSIYSFLILFLACTVTRFFLSLNFFADRIGSLSLLPVCRVDYARRRSQGEQTERYFRITAIRVDF